MCNSKFTSYERQLEERRKLAVELWSMEPSLEKAHGKYLSELVTKEYDPLHGLSFLY